MTQASPQRAAGKATDLLTLDDVRAAAARIEGAVVRTPMQRSQTLSEITGADIWLKFENHQFTAAYKERGALNALLHLSDEQKARGVIAASAGNHSQGLSYHGRRLGVPVTIVMPQTTPSVKVMQTESVGGQVVLHGETFDEAYAHARELEQERGLTFVHPFDDPLVAAGQGTVALEMLAEKDDFDCLVVPIGGGGLMTIGQMCEIAVLAAMPFIVKRLSRKTLLAAGIVAYDGEQFHSHRALGLVGDNFNPEIGFLRRDDFRRTFVQAQFSPRPASIDAVRQFTWGGSLEYILNGAGQLESFLDPPKGPVEADQ